MDRFRRLDLEAMRSREERPAHRSAFGVKQPDRIEATRVPLGADPSVMYLPRPRAKKEVVFEKLGSLTECSRGPRVRLDPRERRWRDPLARSIADYGRGLCRRIDPNHAAEIWAAFLEALETLPPLPEAAPSRWFEDPWYAIDPRHFFERVQPSRQPNLAGGFGWAKDLGFDNVLLLSDLDDVPALDSALAHARGRGLRLLGTLDLDRASDTHAAWLTGADPASLASIRVAFARLARDVSSGISGELFHHVDRWARAVDHPPEGVPSAHALVALFKLFLRAASADQIVLADYAHSGGDVATLVGGDLPGRGSTSSTESDLVIWEAGVEALRKALVDRDSRPLADVLAAVPSVGHGSVLACALEAEGARRLAELVDGDRDRLTLALACLYAMPAIPIVHAGIEVGARGVHLLEHWFLPERISDSRPVRTLEALNRTFSRRAPCAKPRWLALDDRSVVAWVIGTRLFAANLGGMPADVCLEGFSGGVRLGAHGFGWFELQPR